MSMDERAKLKERQKPTIVDHVVIRQDSHNAIELQTMDWHDGEPDSIHIHVERSGEWSGFRFDNTHEAQLFFKRALEHVEGMIDNES